MVEALWALASMQHYPSATWWAAYEQAATQLLSAGRPPAPAPAAGPTGGAAGAPAPAPAPAQQQQQQQQQPAQQGSGHQAQPLGAGSIAELSWALAALRRRPPRPLLRALTAAASDRLPAFDAPGLARLLWSLAELEAGDLEGADPAFTDRLLAECAARMGAFSAHSLAMAASGLATMRRKPHVEWLRRFLAQSGACMGEFRCGVWERLPPTRCPTAGSPPWSNT